MEWLEGGPRKKRKTIPKQRIATTIMHLNNVCLQKIFSYLNVRELMVTEMVCKKFKTIATDVYKTYRVLDINNMIPTGHKKFLNQFEISKGEADKMFRRVGPYVETLKIANNSIKSSEPLTYVSQYCKNLQAIHLDSISFYLRGLRDIASDVAPALRNVKIAHLNNCMALDKVHLQTMFYLKHLKALSLTNVGIEIDGRFLVELKEIKVLNLTKSRMLVIAPDVFVEFCRTNQQLRILKITACPWINGACLWGISKYLINLECLEVSCNTDILQNWYVPLMDLPNLKDLTLLQGKWDIYELIKKLSCHDRLEGLKIYFSSDGYQNPNIWMVIRSFSKLKKLTISQANIFPTQALEDLASTETLEELDISSTAVTNTELQMLVKKLKKIRYINVTNCKNVTEDVIPQIMKHLPGRLYRLILVVKKTSISMWKLNNPLKSDLLMLVNNWPAKYNDIYDV